MSAKPRLLTLILAVTLLLSLGLATVSAAPDAPAPTRPAVSPDIIISDFNNEEIRPNIAYNSKHNEFFVVWHTTGTSDPRTVRGARISGAGKVLADFQINAHATKDSAQPTVAYDPVHDRYLVVFIFNDNSNWDLIGRFIPWNGPSAALKTFPIITWSSFQWDPDIAYGRAVEEFLVVWANQDPTGAVPMYVSGKRIRAVDGSFPSGPNKADTTISALPQNRVNPAVTYNLSRNEYLIVYDNALDIFGKRLTGTLDHDFGGEFGIAGWPDAETVPDVAACHEADQYFVVWQSLQGGTNNAIYGRYIKGDGTPGAVKKIDDTTLAEVEASVDCNAAGTQYLVANQTQYTNLKYGIWAHFVQPNGQMSPNFFVAHATSLSSRTLPAVAGGGANFLIAWEHERDHTAYVDIHGSLVSPYPVYTPVVYGQK